MPKFSDASIQKLETCHSKLYEIFNEVIKHFDCTVLSGYREKKDQDQLFTDGKSKLRFPKSAHNVLPSMAVDVAPYPISWDDTKRFVLFAGFVLGIARARGVILRWGGDWDMDMQLKDNVFNDLVHFELVKG